MQLVSKRTAAGDVTLASWRPTPPTRCDEPRSSARSNWPATTRGRRTTSITTMPSSSSRSPASGSKGSPTTANGVPSTRQRWTSRPAHQRVRRCLVRELSIRYDGARRCSVSQCSSSVMTASPESASTSPSHGRRPSGGALAERHDCRLTQPGTAVAAPGPQQRDVRGAHWRHVALIDPGVTTSRRPDVDGHEARRPMPHRGPARVLPTARRSRSSPRWRGAGEAASGRGRGR